MVFGIFFCKFNLLQYLNDFETVRRIYDHSIFIYNRYCVYCSKVANKRRESTVFYYLAKEYLTFP